MRVRVSLAVALVSVCVLMVGPMCVAHAETFTDDFNVDHTYWDGSTADVSGTIWTGMQGGGYATNIDANTGAAGELQFSHNSTADDGSYPPIDSPALFIDVTGDFDAKLRMDVLPSDIGYLTLALAAWTADQQNAIHLDNVAGTSGHIRFRDLVPSNFDEYRLDIARQPWFRMTRSGNVFEGFYGSDGENWTPIGTIERNYGETLRVGPAAWNWTATAYVGSFSYFEITVVPEPASIVLLISALAAAFFWRRRF